jgi:GR25 family glycosyltransferase involved in LPS biosynthesis
MLNNVDEVYVCHYTKLVERREITNSILLENKILSKWIITNDKEDINQENLKDFVSINKPLGLEGIHKNRTLRLSEISLILKHRDCWLDIIKNDYKSALVLEDDVLLCDDFLNRFNLQIKDIPNDFDIIWIGSCCNLHVQDIVSDKYLYKNNGSRCTHAYLISNKCALKMLDFVKSNKYPADFMFNKAISELSLENYWMEPDLIIQNPVFDTSIQNDISFI